MEGEGRWRRSSRVLFDRAKYPACVHSRTCGTHLRCLLGSGRVERSRCLPPHSSHKPLSNTARGNRASQLRDNGAARRATLQVGAEAAASERSPRKNEQLCGRRAGVKNKSRAATETHNSHTQQRQTATTQDFSVIRILKKTQNAQIENSI